MLKNNMEGNSLSLAPFMLGMSVAFFTIAILAFVLLFLPASDIARYEDMGTLGKSVCDLRHSQSTPPAIWCR